MPPDLEDRTASLDDSLPLTVMKLWKVRVVLPMVVNCLVYPQRFSNP
jgi:hypothetical protein